MSTCPDCHVDGTWLMDYDGKMKYTCPCCDQPIETEDSYEDYEADLLEELRSDDEH